MNFLKKRLNTHFKTCLALGLFASIAVAAESATSENPLDTFGLKKLYPTAPGTLEWNSAHWANGNPRSFNWSTDPDDPYKWTDNRSAGSADPFFKIDGEGVLQMMSSGPRFHINSQQGEKKQFFKNVEWTGYYRRGEASESGPDYGGMVVGVRSGALGHGSGGGNNCDANTYYARFRHDGKWDFEKEWKHPGSYYQSMGTMGKQTPLWGGKRLEADRWIGMKFVVFNQTETTVKLELYIDSISGGVPEKAKWEKVDEAVDDGKTWSGADKGAATVDGCKEYNGVEDAYAAILQGGGMVLIRTDGTQNNVVQAEYKYVTVREIDPFATFAPADTSASTEPTEPADPQDPNENPESIRKYFGSQQAGTNHPSTKAHQFDAKGRTPDKKAKLRKFVKQQ